MRVRLIKLKLERGGKADEVGTDTEACTGARGNGHAGDVRIQNRKGGCSRQGNEGDFVKGKSLSFRNGVSGNGNH